jgi:glyoxylase-like metal-dependent hydrolase (beta-lactamase superfamily II)
MDGPSIYTVDSGYFKLDGGAMFGVVPKSIWSNLNPPDENNMCSWALRCLLVKDGNRNILIDAGVGHKQDPKFRGHFFLRDITHFDGQLGESGLYKEDITDVLLTHLHFDHVGGASFINEKGQYQATFPNAKIWINDYHYQWAINPNPRESASFLKENILPLKEMGLIHFIDVEQDVKFSESITLNFVYGHTGAMMIPTIHLQNNKKVIYCADLLPSTGHLGLPYVMAYDVQPLLTLKEKADLLEKACSNDVTLFLEHDPVHAMIQVTKNEKGKYIFFNA